MLTSTTVPAQPRRRGVIIVYAAFLMVVVFGFAAFAIDIGYIALTKSELQTAADASALAGAMRMADGPTAVRDAASDIATRNFLGRANVSAPHVAVTLGKYDVTTKNFQASDVGANSVKVVVQSGNRALFFAPIFGHKSFSSTAEAIAIINPRDIVFCIDLSGSMNDDTEPAWATETINTEYGPVGYPTIGSELMSNVYADYGFGTYPGATESIGQTLSVSNSQHSYRDLQSDGGALTKSSIATTYRIASGDSAATRKRKVYSWIIDQQLRRLMPKALPLPASADATAYAYWEKYLDYVIHASGSTAPANQDADRITGFNNPNNANYSDTAQDLPSKYRNMVGYLTYVQFLMDWGRDRTPTIENSTNADPTLVKTQASWKNTAWSPKVTEATAAGNFTFPVREQPMHAVRRSVIAALKVVEDQNQGLAPAWSDYVSVVSFDAIDSYHSPILEHPLSRDYRAAMTATARLQAVADINSSTATENGLILARQHLKPTTSGGAARTYTNKVIVLLTDGVPNLYQSSQSTINNYIAANKNNDYYPGGGKLPYNSVLMQSAIAKSESVQLFPVGTGLGADYDFLDRAARMNGTAKDGKSPHGTGNPAAYEQTMTKIFQDIIKGGRVRLAR